MQIISHGEYGIAWPKGQYKFQSELALFANDDLRESTNKTLPKHVHFENAIKMVVPGHYLKWHKWLHRAIESWAYEPIASEWGASGMGKSSDFGLIALFDVLANPSDTLTVIITNPLEMHWERCFKYANLYHSVLPKPFQWLKLRRQAPPGLFYDYDKVTKIAGVAQPAKRSGIICFSNKPGDSYEDLKRRIGSHLPRMRLFVDEPQGCSNTVLKLKINMSVGVAVDFRERFLGNPSGWSNPLGAHSEPRDGDRKKTETLDSWETSRGHKGTFGRCYVRDGVNSPANENPEEFPFLFGPEDLKDAELNYGINSQEYWTYARGRIRGEGGKNVAITEPDLEALDCFRPVIWESGWIDYAGLDAASEGFDGNLLSRIRLGTEAGGQTVAMQVEREELRIDITQPDKSGQIAKQVLPILDRWNIPIDRLAGDITGNQGPVFDVIENECGSGLRVYRVQASGRCSSENTIFKGSAIKRCDRYYDRSTELFYNLVQACRHKQMILTNFGEPDSYVVHQLTSRQLQPEQESHRGRIKIEKKDDWRARNSGKSPDHLDSVCQSLAQMIETGKLVLNESGSVTKKKKTSTFHQQFARPTYNQRRAAKRRKRSGR